MDLIRKVLWMPRAWNENPEVGVLADFHRQNSCRQQGTCSFSALCYSWVFSFPFSLLPLSATRSLPRNPAAACATLKSVLLQEAFYLLRERGYYLLRERGYLAHPQHVQHVAVPPWEEDRLLEIFLFIAFQRHAVLPWGQMDSHHFLWLACSPCFALDGLAFFPQLR